MKAEPLFELHGPDGHVWQLFEDGHITGFPEGTTISNRALPLLNLARSALLAGKQDIPAPLIPVARRPCGRTKEDEVTDIRGTLHLTESIDGVGRVVLEIAGGELGAESDLGLESALAIFFHQRTSTRLARELETHSKTSRQSVAGPAAP